MTSHHTSQILLMVIASVMQYKYKQKMKAHKRRLTGYITLMTSTHTTVQSGLTYPSLVVLMSTLSVTKMTRLDYTNLIHVIHL